VTVAVSHILFLAGGGGRNAISGAEHHVLTLVEELGSRGVDTELIVLLWATDEHIEAALARVQSAGVRVFRIERRPGSPTFLSRLVRALDCWRRLGLFLRGRGDRVVHMHMELVMQVIAARLAGCARLVLSIHNDNPEYRQLARRAWFRCLVRSGVRFVAITDHVRQYLVASVGVAPARVQTIRYGVPMPPRRPPSRHELGLSADDFVVGFVGRLTAQKNVPLLLQAMAQRPDITCVIVGNGERRGELERLAGELGCANVRFLGAQPDAARFMPLFDVFCLPSIWEGLGVVLLEAMLQRVPVVASRAGAIPEVLDGGRCGVLIDPSSVSSLVEALDALRGDARRRQALVAAAHEHATSVYTVRRMGDETCDLYADVCRPLGPASRATA
jgi:glycosyltransferase involved in cell wall biosynthesis